MQTETQRPDTADASAALLHNVGRLDACQCFVGNESGVSLSAVGVEIMPLGFAPHGEIVRVNVNADYAPAFCLKCFAANLGCGEPLIVGPMEFVTVFNPMPTTAKQGGAA